VVGSLRGGYSAGTRPWEFWRHGLVVWAGVLLSQSQYEMIAPYFSTEGAYCPITRNLVSGAEMLESFKDQIGKTGP
jgi:hypothetical protein